MKTIVTMRSETGLNLCWPEQSFKHEIIVIDALKESNIDWGFVKYLRMVINFMFRAILIFIFIALVLIEALLIGWLVQHVK